MLIGPAYPKTRPVEITVALVMHPVGPRPSRIYWVRRVIVVTAGVAVLLGVIFLVAGRSKGSGATAGGLAAYTSGSAAPSLTGVLASDLESESPAAASATALSTIQPGNSASSGPVSATVTPAP